MIRVYAARIPEAETADSRETEMTSTSGKNGWQSKWARQLLWQALNRDYKEVRTPAVLARGSQGKPYLRDYPGLHMNLSHSGSYAACVLGEQPVGVDVEQWKERKHLEKLVKKLHPLEQEAFFQRPQAERERFFYELWVRKESFVKATGRGLRIPLQVFSVIPDDQPVLQETGCGQYWTKIYDAAGERVSLGACAENQELPRQVSWIELSR